jgi:non-ribosomal peptide synthetase-like protein
VLALPASAVLIALTMLVSAAIRWGFLPRMQPGRSAVHSNTYCKKWLVSHIQESSLNVLHGIYATVFAPFWYRLLGAKVGRDAEISTALGVVPDMLTLGDETFIADAVMLGDEQIDGGWMTMEATVVSNRSFVGNGSYIPDGTVLPEGVLVGVHTHAPANERMTGGDTWLGSPPIHLPAREQVSGYPEHLTYRPSATRRLGRALVEAFRIVAPHAVVIAVGYTVVLDLMPLAGAGRWGETIWDLALVGLAYGVGNYLFVLAFKWLLLGRYKKRAEPMWTPFVWLSEGVTNMYEGIAVPNFMRYLRGTPWLPLAFNLLGCRIGKGVYLDTTDITEFDCVHIGDHSELNALSCPQTHLFEDRVMKIDRVDIGSKVYLGPRSAVLYSAKVGDNARIGPLTLVMKGEHIPAATAWNGLPAAPQRGGERVASFPHPAVRRAGRGAVCAARRPSHRPVDQPRWRPVRGGAAPGWRRCRHRRDAGDRHPGLASRRARLSWPRVCGRAGAHARGRARRRVHTRVERARGHIEMPRVGVGGMGGLR